MNFKKLLKHFGEIFHLAGSEFQDLCWMKCWKTYVKNKVSKTKWKHFVFVHSSHMNVVHSSINMESLEALWENN